MSTIGNYFRHINSKIFGFCMATLGKKLLQLILSTCTWHVSGSHQFNEFAKENKCILMLWHNRLAITSFILKRFANSFNYVAFVSNSRDGELIDWLVNSYKTGRTIKVSHQSKHEALRTLIRTIQNSHEIAIITPDGPRGPKYEVKAGIALATLMTQAAVVPMNWKTDRYWEFKTWDKLRLPKPFSQIYVSFEAPINFEKKTALTEVQQHLQSLLPKD